MFLESNGNIVFENEVKNAKLRFLSSNPCITEGSLDTFIESLSLNAPNGADWTFGQSVFFATTLVTTIGYGQMAPMSTNSKLFCIFYSIVGIPLTLILFTALSDRLLVLSNSMLNSLVERYSFQCSDLKIKLSYLGSLVITLSILFIFIPAYVFSSIEPNWSYLDSLYFCFISITTIGLGDYIPGESPQQEFKSLYKIIVSVYLILSLLFTMFVLKTFHAIPELKIMKILSLRFNDPGFYKNASEYQILFGKGDSSSISKLYSQDSDTLS
ncbi:hypothetical protein M8J76_014133 [Diaphorina citri]|nr:hypothetical protein M8J75_009537 [Diaphorina citri]KAI5727097.1 hypothetical protein M8J76_014133 [Diaphorina citri]